MPSLRQRVSSYFRQLSFYNEPKEKKLNINENSFITKYLEGLVVVREGPPIVYGKNATDLPNYELNVYSTGPDTVVGCYSGPNGGLTTVKRLEKHLSVTDTDIDFIDILDEPEVPVSTVVIEKSPQKTLVDNTTMVIKVAGQEYLVTNRTKSENKFHSLGSLSDIEVEIEKTKICSINNNNSVICENFQNKTLKESDSLNNQNIKNSNLDRKVSIQSTKRQEGSQEPRSSLKKSNLNEKKLSYGLTKSKSEGNPFQHKKRGKIIKLSNRPTSNANQSTNSDNLNKSDPKLPNIWNRKTEHIYGISDSLYDTNQVTKCKNGDPIADCFGVIARNDSAILAVADGVNWGEKASIAAKSAIHGCLDYLNKTLFNDTKSFDDLITLNNQKSTPILNHTRITNTRDVFICLLRAFNCAHDLILENDGMLTTLTVAVILPLNRKNVESVKSKSDNSDMYVCCVCNVGDTLAYVYSQKYGIRELTKGSHDINCNRDMRDALGALGPVDGINPELSNLTLSLTTVQKGDIVFVASDGLTDNFDSNVCKFTVNTKEPVKRQPSTSKDTSLEQSKVHFKTENIKSKDVVRSGQVPIKPPRKNRDSTSRSSRERSVDSTKSAAVENKKPDNIATTSSATNVPNSNSTKATDESNDLDNPLLIQQFLRENSLEQKENSDTAKKTLETKSTTQVRPKTASLTRQTSRNLNIQNPIPKRSQERTKPTKSAQLDSKAVGLKRSTSRGGDVSTKANTVGFLRSKTSIDMRSNKKTILRNEDGIPFVTPMQRYEISLLLMEDVLKHGISGHDFQCTTAKTVCENLVNFTFSISAAKRHTLEDSDLYFDNINGVLVEISQQEKKIRRRRGLERVQNLPGKLDHVSIVAYNVGNFASMF